MGNTNFTIPLNLSRQWKQVTRGYQKWIINCITQEQFQIKTIPRQNNDLQIKNYKERSVYSTANTPKVIVAEESSSLFTILVQRSHNTFRNLMRKKTLLFDVLNTIKELTLSVQQLKQKYGAFQIQKNMIGVSKNEKLIVWFHEDYAKNVKEKSSTTNTETKLIQEILNICEQYSCLNLDFLRKSLKQNCYFNDFIKTINLKIELEKFTISEKLKEGELSGQKKNEVQDFNTYGEKKNRVERFTENLAFPKFQQLKKPFARHRRNNTVDFVTKENQGLKEKKDKLQKQKSKDSLLGNWMPSSTLSSEKMAEQTKFRPQNRLKDKEYKKYNEEASHRVVNVNVFEDFISQKKPSYIPKKVDEKRISEIFWKEEEEDKSFVDDYNQFLLKGSDRQEHKIGQGFHGKI